MHVRTLLACLTLLFATTSARELACKQSGYCSLGVSQNYTGDIRSGAALRDFIKAVSYKSELILISYYDMDGSLVDLVMQLLYELRGLGFGHFFLLALFKDSCDRIQARHAGLSCVWDSSTFTYKLMSDVDMLWNMRWRMFARVGRLGVNMISLDADMMVLQDPYVYLKQPPLQSMTVICQEEAGMPYCNGGFMYMQNAAPDGPATWAFKFIGDLPLRMVDDGGKHMIKFHLREHGPVCLTFDQDLIFDAFVSALVGRLVLPTTIMKCMREDHPDAAMKARRRSGMDRASKWVASNIRFPPMTVAPPPHIKLKYRMSDMSVTASVAQLHVPNLALGWSQELGGQLLPALGNASRSFHDQLREDCPACPWWAEDRPVPAHMNITDLPDVTKATMGFFHDAEGAKHNETMGMPPGWLISGTASYKFGLVQGPQSPVPHPFVFSHVHAWHLAFHNMHKKTNPRKMLGRYNWTLATSILSELNTVPYSSTRPVTRVLALSPDLDLGYTRTWTDMAHVLLGLVQVALLTKRTPVFPNIPCHASWLHAPGADDEQRPNSTWCERPVMTGGARFEWPLGYPLPVDQHGWLLGSPAPAPTNSNTSHAVYLPQEDADTHLRFALPMYWDGRCLAGLHAIFQPELQHWLAEGGGRHAEVAPSAANTAMLLSPSASALLPWYLRPANKAAHIPQTRRKGVLNPRPDRGWSLADVVAGLPVGQVLKEMRRFQDQPLVYLGHPVAVLPPRRQNNTSLQESLAGVQQVLAKTSCRALFADPATMGKAWWFELTRVVNTSSARPALLQGGRISADLPSALHVVQR